MPYRYYVFTHQRSKMPEVIARRKEEHEEDAPRDHLKACLKSQMEPTFLIVKDEIDPDKKKRKRGVWAHGRGSTIYFTCPWCGAIQTTGRAYADTNNYDSVWCGYGDQPGCQRHLMNLYVKDPNDPKLVYMDKNL